MNNRCYRLVFSKLRGMLVAVAETAIGHSLGHGETGPSPAHRPITLFAMRHVAFAALVLLGAAPALSDAQIVPSGAHAPSAISTANGLPQVNVNKPSSAGVSLNTYSQFDVSKNGAILNNSPVNVNTQLGGMISGNPNYGPNDAAKIIVNQVNSNNPSLLRGYVEVAGAKTAAVVIANSSGLMIDGGGFVNTSKGILTTGNPLIDGSGNLTGFNVTSGSITVQGAGLNASNIDEVDLLARAVQVNAAIYANALNVTTGSNNIDYASLTPTPVAGSGARPAVSIDVSQLGGMYANCIILTSNENGVGVANAGFIAAQSGDLTLSTSGQLVQSGTMTATGNVGINATGVANTGTIYAQQGTTISSSGAVTNSGTIAAQQNAAINAGSLDSTGILGAGVNNHGSLGNSGSLNVSTGGQLTATGENVAGSNATLSGSSVNLTGSQTAANGNVSLTANAGDLNLAGATTSGGGSVVANATGTLDNDNGSLVGNSVALNATNLVNHAGTITQTGTGPMSVNVSNTLDNSAGGTIQTNSTDLTLAPATLDNDGGTITLAGTGTLTLNAGNGAGSISNAGGTIQSNGKVVAGASSFNNAAGFVLGQTGVTATVGGALNNTNGKLLSNADLSLASGTLNNNGGEVAAASNGTIQSGSMSNSGGSIVAPDLALSIGSTLNNSDGDIEANQLALRATDLLNHGGTITQYGASSMGLNVSNTLDNSAGGTIQTNSADLTLAPANFDNDGGTITHAGAGTLTITPGNGSGALANVGGKIITAGQIAAQAGSLDNAGGVFAAQGNIAASVAGNIDNTQGAVRSLGSLSFAGGGTLTNTNGQIQSGTGAAGDTSTLGVQAASIDNTNGLVSNLGTGNTTVQGGSQIINSGGGVTGNGNVAVDTSALSNTQGGQVSGGSVDVQANTVDNSGGVIGSFAGPTGDVAITTTGAIANTNGQIGATHNLTVDAAALTAGGAYSAANDVAINIQGDFAPTAGFAFNAGHDLSFTLPGTFANGGALEATDNLDINASDIANSGAMMAGGALTTRSNTLENTGAIVGGSVSLNATRSVTNVGPTALIGATDSNGLLEILAPDIENRDDTTMTDTQATTAIYGLGKVVLAGGKDASGSYTNANLIRNQSALIQSAGDMGLYANQVTNTRRVTTTDGVYVEPLDASSPYIQQFGISLSGCAAADMAACGPGNPQVMGVQFDPNASNYDPAVIAGLQAQPGGMPIDPPHGGQWNSTYQYTTYTGVALANLMTAISPQAQIIAGGNLDASKVSLFQNYWSAVAAVGNIAAPVTLDQNSWRGQLAPGVQVTYSGQYHYDNYDNSEHNWQLPFGNATFKTSNPGGYQVAPADIRTYALPSYESIFVAGGTLSGTGVSINNTAGNAGVPSLGLAAGQSATGVNAGAVGGNLAQVNPIIASATAVNVLSNLTIPQGGLFHRDTAPNAPYLIETNPAFTSQTSFISSNYYLQQLGLNPQAVEKRLGDGLYEQQLVQNQITSLTGKAVLGPYSDTQSMYEALLGAGASLAQSLDLPLGMSLSAAQVAALTSNVIIMQTEVVDGQSVLVPVVYLAQASQQDMNGPLIAATDIDLQNAQTFNNSGTVQASNTLSIQGQQINNAFGTLQSGGLMSLTTTGNVDLTSATVNAGSLALNAGGNLILNTAVNTVNQVSETGATRTTTTLGPIANLNVKGNAAIVTGGNVEQNGANLTVGGNLGMSVGGNYDLGSVQTGEHKVVARANGVSDTNINSTTGSSVSVGGVSEIGVGGNLTATGADINLGGGGIIAAKGNVTLQAATATSTIDSNSSGSDHHGSYSDSEHLSDDTVTATTLHSGNSLAVVAGNDINVTGSTVELDKGTALLAAAGNVNVGATTETHISDVSSTGSHNGVASHKSTVDQVDQSATYADGSTISADSVAVQSGKDINVTSSSIVGTNQVSLQAQGNVNITDATNTYQDSEYHQVKESGLSGSGGLGVTIGSSEQSDRYNGSSVTQSQSRSAVGAVAGNVSISAGKDVHVSGSDIVAGTAAGDVAGTTGNIAITGQNVTIDPGQDAAQSRDQQEARSSGLTVALTGTLFDTARNIKADASSGNGFQRTQNTLTEIGASAADTPSISVSYGRSQSSSTTAMSSLTNSGSTIRGGNNVSITATGGAVTGANGQPLDGDLSVIGSTISAGGTTTLAANRNVNLEASTDQLQQSSQSSSSSMGISLATPSLGDAARWIGGTANTGGTSPSPYNAGSSASNGNETSATQTATVVSGNSVVVKSKAGDINVVGSGISGTQGVDLVAQQGAINVMAGVDTDVSHQESSSHQVGSLGSNGTSTGFSVGVSSSHGVQDTASQTQSTMRSQIVSGNGNVTLDANQDVTVQGSDLAAAKDLTLIGKNVNLDAGTDATQDSASQSASQFGVSVALGGAVGNAIATVNQSVNNAAHAGDARLAALDTAQAGLAAYNAYQVATATGATSQPLIKATVSIGGGTSHSQSQSDTVANNGSTLTAGGDVTVVATGSGAKDANGQALDGDITASGTQISGQNVTLNAARDITLQSTKDTSEQSGSSSSTSGSIGIGAGIGGQQNGFTLELAASGSKGNVTGNGVTNVDTTVNAANTLTMTSGRDTNLRGAEVAGNTVEANVGRDLNIASQQDTNTYNSQQASAGVQASICVPPFCYGTTVTGTASASDATIKDNFQSVNQQSGIYAGNGGFDVNVGNHTQLDGGVIASTATPDQNTLSTQTLGYTNLQNTADYSGTSVGFSVSGGIGKSAPAGVNASAPTRAGNSQSSAQNSAGYGPVGFGAAGTSDSASGTTYTAVSPGTITVRGDAGTGQDSTAGLSRDTANANGSVANTFNAQDVQNDMAVQQGAVQVGMQVVGDVAQHLYDKAYDDAAAAQKQLDAANASGDQAAAQQAQADLNAANAQMALWGDDGTARIAAHAAVAAVGAAMGGGNVAGAVAGTVAGDEVGSIVSSAAGGTPGGALLGNIAAGAAGALAGGAVGGTSGAMSGANGALGADLYNRQLHPQEKPLAQQLAAKSNGQYTEQDVENQMALMNLTVNGQTESGGVRVATGTQPQDGTDWQPYGVNQAGQQVWAQSLGPGDPDLQAYIVKGAQGVGLTYQATTTGSNPGLVRAPDMVNFQVDYFVGSVWGTFTRDGSAFFGGGLNLNVPNPVNAGVGISAVWLNSPTVSPGQANNFAGGYAGGVTGAYDFVGGGLMYSPGNGTATAIGVGAGLNLGKTTNIGTVGGGYSVDQGQTRMKW
ncbi:filamentous hemagglutinin [Paraburkholderia sp. GAS333]|uniref:hemagglutinin repeat-containing protein n=1 Tax=Paraburkholderia sp. GAS333 TaxID=3156279 RepID=UPI003D1F4C0C